MRAQAGLITMLILSLGSDLMSAGAANAVVYCKTVGVPKGCVARPAATVVHPVARPRVVYCTRPGVPAGCVVR
jgi:hypothetical protein